jgi:hypothetical protein
LLDALAGGLRLLPEIQLGARPRMADFARWGEAVARALGQPPLTFLTAYLGNRNLASQRAIDDSPVARAVLRLVNTSGSWKGTATTLFALLARTTRDPISDVRRWPRSPRWLADELRRAAPLLRTRDVIVTFDRSGAGRQITLARRNPPPGTLRARGSGTSSMNDHRAPVPQPQAGQGFDAK